MAYPTHQQQSDTCLPSGTEAQVEPTAPAGTPAPHVNTLNSHDISNEPGKKRTSQARRSIQLFDPVGVTRAMAALNVSEYGSPDQVANRRIEALQKLLDDQALGERHLIFGKPQMAAIMKVIGRVQPNFVELTGVIQRALLISIKTNTPLWLPPVLIAGPPGIGKTRYARALADALQTSFLEIAMNALDDTGSLVGHSASWTAARTGLIADKLVEGSTASPVVLLDEIDKTPPHHSGDRPLNVLHGLLESESARRFTDAFLNLPIRADHIIWVATANDIHDIPASILDRFLIIHVAGLTKSDRHLVVQRIIRICTEKYTGFDPTVAEDALDVIDLAMSARTIHRLVKLACGYAAADGRVRLTRADIASAAHLCRADADQGRSPVGFLSRPMDR